MRQSKMSFCCTFDV